MRSSQKMITGKALAWLLTLVYFTSYVTRVNFAASILEVVTATGFEKSALSVILVSQSVTYGVGQLLSGRLGDKIKPTTLIFGGLIVAVVTNLLFPALSFSVALMSVAWAINGLAQAMMWPPMVKILVANTDDAMYGYSVVRISWGSSFGTIFVYLSAPLIIRFLGWEAVFLVCALVGVAVCVLWGFLMSRISLSAPAAEGLSADNTSFHFPMAALFPMIFIVLGIIFQGMLRDGISSWMPSYLAEVFNMGNSASILCTVSLAIFAIICQTLSAAVYKRFFKNEVFCGFAIFSVAAAFALLMFCFYDAGKLIAILAMAMITGCMHGINLMLITHVPKRYKKYGNISTVAGVVNSCTYVGSSISTYGIALLSETLGWRYTVGVWFLIALMGCVCCLVATRPWKRFMEK